MLLRRLATIAALAAGGYWLKKKMGPNVGRGTGELSFVQDSIEIDVPISTVYNQWTQFEEFPNFMKDVLDVRQIDDTHLHWRANIAGKPVEWSGDHDADPRSPHLVAQHERAAELGRGHFRSRH